MTIILLPNWIVKVLIFSSITIFSSCGDSGDSKQIEQKIENNLIDNSSFELCGELKKNDVVFVDTIIVKTAVELRNSIKSHRILILKENKYNLKSTLQIDSIKNLKLIGTGLAELMIFEKNGTVINLLNSKNIYFDNLVIGHSKNQEHHVSQGIIRIERSSNINISKCKILGFGTFGLTTNDVCNLTFRNSEITKCTAIIFELKNSRKFKFENSTFHDNNLGVSVLGGFTNSTKEITFSNCEFFNNKPKMAGNPAFNFNGNWTNFDEQIIFSNCTFKNNSSYNWYGDKIKLDNCKIDSTDFIGLQINN